MENSGYLFAAYAVIWAVVFGYILFMQWKQKKLQQQITLLEQSVDGQKTTDAEQSLLYANRLFLLNKQHAVCLVARRDIQLILSGLCINIDKHPVYDYTLVLK